MKNIVIVMVALMVLALAIVVGGRMSTDAMAVAVGIVCGIGASIPTSLLMIYLLTRHRDEQCDAGHAPNTTYHVETMNVLQLRGDDASTTGALSGMYLGGRYARYLADGNQRRITARRS